MINQNGFPSSNLSFVASACLAGLEAVRVGEFEFILSPYDKARVLWDEFQRDQLSYSPRILAQQIGELKRTAIDGSYQRHQLWFESEAGLIPLPNTQPIRKRKEVHVQA